MPIKSILDFLQKHRGLVAFCFLMLVILGVSLLTLRFLNLYVLIPQEVQESVIKQEGGVNIRLYREVSEKIAEDEARPLSGIGDLRNPFYR